MEEAALKRKQRLLELKRKTTSRATDDSGRGDQTENLEEQETSPLKRAAFRSYNPVDPLLQTNSLPKLQPVDLAEHIEDQLVASKDTSVMDEMDLTTLAPRKIDWDLKRDAEKKFQKLERRTQRAIAELIRERLSAGKEDLLLSAVNTSSKAAEQSRDSDED